MKKIRTGIFLLIFWMAVSSGVCAEEGESVRLDDKGNVIIYSSSMAEDGTSTMSMTISVEAGETDSVEFLFAQIGAEVLEYRYDREKKVLQLYIAGREPLFTAGTESLSIGQIRVKDGNGAGISAKVKIEEGALEYVYGSEVRMPEEMDFPGTVRISAGTSSSPAPPSGSGTSDSGGTSQGDSGSGSQDTGDNTRTPGNTGQGTGGQGTRPYPSPEPVSPTPVTPPPASESGENVQDQSGEQESGTTVPSANPYPENGDAEEEPAGEGAGINWVIVLAIAVIAIFAGVVIWAFVTLNRKPGE